MEIIAPVSTNDTITTQLFINTSASNSAQFLNINASFTDTIVIECSLGDSSCGYMTLDAKYSSSIRLTGSQPYALRNLTLFGEYIGNAFSMTCDNEHTCNHQKLHLNYSTCSVDIDCSWLGNSCDYNEWYFNKNSGDLIDITCESCINTVISTQHKNIGNVNLVCRSNGCNEMDFYVYPHNSSSTCYTKITCRDEYTCNELNVYSTNGYTYDNNSYGLELDCRGDDGEYCYNMTVFCGNSYQYSCMIEYNLQYVKATDNSKDSGIVCIGKNSSICGQTLFPTYAPTDVTETPTLFIPSVIPTTIPNIASSAEDINISLSWQVSNQLLPFRLKGIQIGLWDGIVYIFGGEGRTTIYSIPVSSIFESQINNVLLWTDHGEWDVENDTNVGKSAIDQMSCIGMCYTQISNLVYIIGANKWGIMLIYNMESEMGISSKLYEWSLPYNITWSCIVNNKTHIFSLAGRHSIGPSNYTLIYDIENDAWAEGSQLNVARYGSSCIFSDEYNLIAVYGGLVDFTENITIDSVEIYDIFDDIWYLLHDTLSYKHYSSQAILLNSIDFGIEAARYNTQFALVIGGRQNRNGDNKQSVNQTDVFELISASSMIKIENSNWIQDKPNGHSQFGLIKYNSTMFITFGGCYYDDSWQTSNKIEYGVLDINLNTNFPSMQPSMEPSIEPSNEPSKNPTVYPSIQPLTMTTLKNSTTPMTTQIVLDTSNQNWDETLYQLLTDNPSLAVIAIILVALCCILMGCIIAGSICLYQKQQKKITQIQDSQKNELEQLRLSQLSSPTNNNVIQLSKITPSHHKAKNDTTDPTGIAAFIVSHEYETDDDIVPHITSHEDDDAMKQQQLEIEYEQ